MKLWNTAGSDRFRNLTYQFYRQADGMVILFDLNNANSFDNIQTWIMSIRKVKNATIPILLVGNNQDEAGNRVVSRE